VRVGNWGNEGNFRPLLARPCVKGMVHVILFSHSFKSQECFSLLLHFSFSWAFFFSFSFLSRSVATSSALECSGVECKVLEREISGVEGAALKTSKHFQLTRARAEYSSSNSTNMIELELTQGSPLYKPRSTQK
jgi:hypothetical protein